MKTIKEAANDFVWRTGETHAQTCFIEGVKYAHRWISVEDEKPATMKKVLCRLEDNEVTVGYISIRRWFILEYNQTGAKVIHWRPIEFE